MENYKNRELSIEARIDDLMSRMTIEEKVGQMMQLPANNPLNRERLEEQHIGSYLHCTGEMMISLQKQAEKSRLGIPLIFGIDAIHGHCFDSRGTVFPTQLAMSSSWNRELIQKMGEITAKEVRANGIHWTFSPVLCVGRDARWGRVGETFGEDPWLIGEMASELIKGYQGDEVFSNRDNILACAKHYVAYGETKGGRDSYEADISERTMLTHFLPPFEKVVRKGCATLMAGYQSINGVPCSSSKWLLTDIAKEKWELNGFIVTDWNNAGSLHEQQYVAQDLKEAAFMAIQAGNDMIMTTPSFYENTLQLITEKRIPLSRIDDSVKRILQSKFTLGLFDEFRHTPPSLEEEVFEKKEHRETALQASRESLVLLKNRGILPLDKQSVKKIALIGPNADDVVAQLGDWSFGSMQAGASNDNFHRDQTSTLLSALKARASHESIELYYIKGADTIDSSFDEIGEAVKIAAESDLVIAAVGDTLKLHGEFHDRADLDLSGKQQALLEAVKKTGTPLCTILITSKPLTIPWVKTNSDACICAFNPGAGGGTALTELIFGDYNPSGKLTISFPHHSGQIPVHYNRFTGWHSAVDAAMEGEERYIDMPEEPVFVFGEGKSFTQYNYSDLQIDTTDFSAENTLTVSITLSNTGQLDGYEIVQLYINDVYSSVTTPVKELKAFRKISIKAGESLKLAFQLSKDDLSLIDKSLNRVFEPGDFDIMVGSSSRDSDLIVKRMYLS